MNEVIEGEAEEVPPLNEHQRQIMTYHETLHSVFSGADDIVVAQSCAAFMGCHMAHTKDWKRIIEGFMNEMTHYANAAIAAHAKDEGLAVEDVPTEENNDGSQEAQG